MLAHLAQTAQVRTAAFLILSRAYVQSQIEITQGQSGMAARNSLFQREKTIRPRTSHRRPVSRKTPGRRI